MSRVPRLPSAVEDKPPTFDTMFAHAPSLVEAVFGLYGALWRSDVAGPELKELLRLRGARTIDCFL
jgi:hypothetical protein